jgi:competence protein ComEC
MPLLWLSLAFVAGILFAARLALTTADWLLLAAATLSLQLLWPILPLLGRLKERLPVLRYIHNAVVNTTRLPVLIIILTLFLGSARYQAAQPHLNPDFIAWYNDTQINLIVEGIVIEPPEEGDSYTSLRVSVEQLRAESDPVYKSVEGRLLVRVPPGGNWRYGDQIRLEGRIETPGGSTEAEPGDFSYQDYLKRQGIYSTMSPLQAHLLQHGQGNSILALIYSLKTRSLSLVYRLWPDPEASLLAGILLGVETGISAQVQRAFQDTGTSHIIAISGFNISIIAGLFASLFGRFLGLRKGAVASVLGIGFYTLLVGASASVLRAAIMGGLALFARQVGRRQDGLNSLAFTAFLMSLLNPEVLWGIGFQLSFAATLGLVLYADPLAQAFLRLVGRYLPVTAAEKLVGLVGEYCLFTLAAQLTTLPVTIYHFQRFSLSSLVANIAILPAQPPVMTLGGLALMLGLVYYPLGQMAAPLAWPFVLFTIRVVEWFASLPSGVLVTSKITLFAVCLYYGLLLGLTFGGPALRSWMQARWGNLKAVFNPALALVGLSLITVVVWQAAVTAPDGRLHVTVLDVGSGDAVLIQSPGGHRVLVDGGPKASLLSDALGRRLPAFARKLDYLVVAGISAEQIGSLPRNIERFRPEAVLWAGEQLGTPEARALEQSLNQAQISITPAETGQTLDFEDGARLRLLAVSQRGAILQIEYGDFRLLLPIGLDNDTLNTLWADNTLLPVTALLLAESGYAPINPTEWIAKLHPQAILLSVAVDDRYGRPSPETLQAVEGYSLLRTDKNGWIELTTDGKEMLVQVQRP